MEGSKGLLLLVAVMFVSSIYSIITAKKQGSEDGYKQGQIDALQGKIKYRLSKNENGEEVWTKIEEQ